MYTETIFSYPVFVVYYILPWQKSLLCEHDTVIVLLFWFYIVSHIVAIYQLFYIFFTFYFFCFKLMIFFHDEETALTYEHLIYFPNIIKSHTNREGGSLSIASSLSQTKADWLGNCCGNLTSKHVVVGLSECLTSKCPRQLCLTLSTLRYTTRCM